MNILRTLFGEKRRRPREGGASAKPKSSIDVTKAASDCISLLQAAHEWGEKRNFGATWMEDSPQYRSIRTIGEAVHEANGLEGMEYVIQLVRASYRHGYTLDHFWDGIGEWRA